MAANGDSTFPCPPASSLQTLVDDNDPRISYSGGWIDGGDPGFECKGTTHGAEGANVTATLNFNGVGVQVFGSIGFAANDGSPSSTYQVDNLPASTFVFNANGQNNYRVQFYASPLLNAGNHTLIITSLGNNNSRIWLDYILYYPTTNSASNLSATSTPSGSASSATFSPTSDTDTTTHRASDRVALIAGAVVGSVAGIFVGALLYYVLLRWHHKHQNTYQTVTPYAESVTNTAVPPRDDSTVSRAGRIQKGVIFPSERLENTIRSGASSPQELAPVISAHRSPPSYHP
ncbi:hypothetical protein BDP27DRAFT_1421817 [Rhodocollybia butyracea]|uniref:Uncharacterized protein n=1 Tax=Rhodocollybia butyracea TaxID=206335 RepID=A0A9P5PS80_9AGAR|nr:hypothetical protein BDP27DRAFT_1421817 [Rhodocollybia butyracea]